MNVLSGASNSGRNAGASGSRSFGVRYPSPFFDIAQQFLPDNVHQLHLWCRYYFLTNPVINAACHKLAEYPVTDLLFQTSDPEVKKLYTTLSSRLQLRKFQVEVGLDFFVYGNAFVSIYYPMEKYLKCRKCDKQYRAKTHRAHYTWRNMRFFLSCPSCKTQEYAREKDVYVRRVRDIKLIRWNPENLEIKHVEASGLTRYYYKMPRSLVNDVKLGDRDVVEGLPTAFMEAARKGRALLFDPNNFYHLKRSTIAQKDQGWGAPLLYPLLKDAFYLQVMKKANEALFMEHIVPMRTISPGNGSAGTDNPFGAYNLTNWKTKVEAEINTWRRDPNHIPIFPVNVGFQQWGGTAKSLNVTPEYRMHAEMMLSGAGIPPEFVFGGLQWSASNTALRALENMFTGYNLQRHDMFQNFILGNIASFMRYVKCPMKFDRFKMADDLQRSMFMLQLNQAGKISDHRLLEELGEDAAIERERMDAELKQQLKVQRASQMASADIQGGAQLRQSRYQAKSQKLMMIAQTEAQQEAMAAGMPPEGMATEGGGGAPAPAPTPAATGGEGQERGQETAQNIAGMPDGASVYSENAQDAQNQDMPVAMQSMQSPIQPGMTGGLDLRAIATRASSYLDQVEEANGAEAAQSELGRMQVANPSLYKLVMELRQSGGSRVNPLEASPTSPGLNAAPGRTVA